MAGHVSGRYIGEVVALTCDCELGRCDERAVVLWISTKYMRLVFPNRDSGREVNTGADYKFLRAV
jgi:hypothetical protein